MPENTVLQVGRIARQADREIWVATVASQSCDVQRVDAKNKAWGSAKHCPVLGTMQKGPSFFGHGVAYHTGLWIS